MPRARSVCSGFGAGFRVLAVMAAGALAWAQDGPAPPQQTIEQGLAIFRSNCAFCHGISGQGGRGPNLVSGEPKPDDQIKQIIKNGVPGTTMPSYGGFEEVELNRVVAFLRHLRGSAKPGEKPVGDAGRGQQVYARNACAACHVVNGAGKVYGPDLSRIGQARSMEYLRESIVEPSHDIPPEYEGVTVTGMDGRKWQGIRVNEDTFSVQMRLPNEQFQTFVKERVRTVQLEKQSLMPAYKAMKKEELDDLVAYLMSLRAGSAGSGVKEAQGIK